MVPTANDWLAKNKTDKQQAIRQLIHEDKYYDYIKLVSIDDGIVVASLGKHYDYAIFGRDSIRVAKDLLNTHRILAHNIILTLAHLQGTRHDDKSEEEPGKIHHEHRSLMFLDKRIPGDSEKIMRDLQRYWCGEGTDEMTYYGSYDSTPLYIRLVASYIKKYGAELLDETFTSRDGHENTIRDSFKAAVEWLVKHLENSSWGLLEYKRINPNGLVNQAWKDSWTSYMHANGMVANYDHGIAAIELQGYAYDALFDACALLPDGPIEHWKMLAKTLQATTLDKFWMEESSYFAQGLDRDEHGTIRQIATLTSNPALLLRSKLLKDLEPERHHHYTDKIVKMIMGPEFLTMGGIRCRALRHKDIPGFADYHGTYVSWPKETYEIAKGLASTGHLPLANDLEVRILNSVMTAGEFYEFFYVNDDGTVWYDRDAAVQHFEPLAHGNHIAVPEMGQAWTISAVMAILNERRHLHNHEILYQAVMKLTNS